MPCAKLLKYKRIDEIEDSAGRTHMANGKYWPPLAGIGRILMSFGRLCVHVAEGYRIFPTERPSSVILGERRRVVLCRKTNAMSDRRVDNGMLGFRLEGPATVLSKRCTQRSIAARRSILDELLSESEAC